MSLQGFGRMVLQGRVMEHLDRLGAQLSQRLAAVATPQALPKAVQGLRQRLAQPLTATAGEADLEQPYPSVVIEYTVPRGKTWAFRSWHRRLVKAAQRSEGFLRADRYRPLAVQDDCLKWYTVMHFEQPQQLHRWLESSDREALLKAGRDIFKSYKFKSFETGLEGWFCDQSGEELTGLGPPAWKEILAVVLGLYPIIMVQGFVLERLDLFEDWDPASAMLVNNLITTCIFTLIVMPRIVRWLNFWLRPAHRRAPLQIEVIGTVVTVLAMAAMVYLFSEIA
jgi:antibiotic biosynthesis monooxygenase (ABM) superfamily enzyme